MMMASTVAAARTQRHHHPHQQHATALKTNVMNNDDNTDVVDDDAPSASQAPAPPPTVSNSAPSTLADIAGLLQSTTMGTTSVSVEKSLATMELQYFKAVSLYRRRNYEKCVEVCNAMLQAGHENNVQMFNTPPEDDDDDGDGVERNAQDQANDFKNHSTTTTMPHGTATSGHVGPIGGSGGSGGGVVVGIVSNNSSSGNIQRYGSNLQRIAARQGGRQRGIYGNNVNSASSSSTATGTTSSATGPDGGGSSSGGASVGNSVATGSFSIMPTWMMEGVWQLKMRALTQRIYIDDLETNDADDAGMYVRVRVLIVDNASSERDK